VSAKDINVKANSVPNAFLAIIHICVHVLKIRVLKGRRHLGEEVV
jgi:hypothetical protein